MSEALRGEQACLRCGGTSFFVNVQVIGTAWCDAEVTTNAQGRLTVHADSHPRDSDLEVDCIDEVGCADCDTRVPRGRMDDLIGPRYEPCVGDRVTLPDDLDGVIEAILPPRWKTNTERDPRTWVVIGGREYPNTDLAPVRPNPNQLHLLEMAA